MIRMRVRLFAIIICVSTIVIQSLPISAQDFPYLAPEAPEFDGRGTMVRNPVRGEQSPKQRNQGSPQPPSALRVEPPTIPNAPYSGGQLQGHPVAAPRVPIFEGPSEASQRSTRQTSPPQVYDQQGSVNRKPSTAPPATKPQPQTKERQDCSQFPILIANSRSEAEMQFTARRFLTCLMDNGWNADQARQQVINIIESAYRPPR
ncbi:MAG: hypothetical protein QG577_568 [Thermodesulfobacteriota bacterium]|nr:hypothetical protein [Thermodesulfobacteriota bacterium]